jgi:hypothetical protein
MGAFLMLVSVFFLAGAFVSFAVIDIGAIIVPGVNEILAASKGQARLNPSHHAVKIVIEHPFLEFAAILFLICMCCVVLGAILRNR